MRETANTAAKRPREAAAAAAMWTPSSTSQACVRITGLSTFFREREGGGGGAENEDERMRKREQVILCASSSNIQSHWGRSALQTLFKQISLKTEAFNCQVRSKFHSTKYLLMFWLFHSLGQTRMSQRLESWTNCPIAWGERIMSTF